MIVVLIVVRARDGEAASHAHTVLERQAKWYYWVRINYLFEEHGAESLNGSTLRNTDIRYC